MESKITIIRDNNGKVLGTKRQNPTTKPVINKPLTVDGKTVFNISELMLKRKCGKELTEMEDKVLNDYLMNENCKKLTEKTKPLPTLAEVKAKMARGEKLTTTETNVLLADIKKTEAEYAARRKNAVAELNMRYSALNYQERLRQHENKITGYKPQDNKVKGGFERALEKMHQLGKTKAELTEKSAKTAEKIAKLLEFCKKYGKSIKA